jgi:hypothetical protein
MEGTDEPFDSLGGAKAFSLKPREGYSSGSRCLEDTVTSPPFSRWAVS